MEVHGKRIQTMQRRICGKCDYGVLIALASKMFLFYTAIELVTDFNCAINLLVFELCVALERKKFT